MRTLGPCSLLVMAFVVAGVAVACSSAGTASTADPAGSGAGAPSGAAGPGATTPRKPTDDNGPTPTKVIDPTNDPNSKPCTGAAGSLYALSAKKLTVGDDVPLCRFDGSVMLLVNVASHCGNTPQYAPLQTLYEKYRAQGFYILGFPSPQFGGQEFADEKDVTAFCTNEYHITFPMFSIGDVNGVNKQPVYAWVHSQPGGPPPEGYARDVQWNFEKYLIGRHGNLVQRIENGTAPDDPAVTAAIEAEIAKK